MLGSRGSSWSTRSPLYYRTQLFAARHRARGELCEMDEGSSWCRPMRVECAREELELAEGRSQAALHEHAQPPPDAGYARRLRVLADAAAQEQAAYRYADEHGFGWRPGPAWLPPRELRPAPWRPSLAPVEMWERFDEAVEALSRARTGVSVMAIAQAFGQLSAAAWELAGAVERGHRQRAGRAS